MKIDAVKSTHRRTVSLCEGTEHVTLFEVPLSLFEKVDKDTVKNFIDCTVDAGTVYNTTSKTATQLLNERKELLDALSAVLGVMHGYTPMDGGNSEDDTIIERAGELVEKLELINI